MAAIIIPPNTAILKNRGFQFKVCVLEKDDLGKVKVPYQRTIGAEGEPEIELIWFRIDNSLLADIEEVDPYGWGSIDGWEKSLNTSPVRTIAKTLAMFLEDFIPDRDGKSVPNIKRASKMLLDGVVADYLVAVSNAMLMAQGIDPEALREASEMALVQVAKKGEEAKATILEAFREATADTQTSPPVVSPSPNGLPDGAKSEEALTSIGV